MSISLISSLWNKISFCLLLAILTGCGAGVKVAVTSHSPGNSSVIYMEPGQQQEFAITGPVYQPFNESLFQVGVQAQWYVHEYEPNNYLAGSVLNIIPTTRAGDIVENRDATFLNAYSFRFTAPEVDSPRYYVVSYIVYRHNLGGSWKYADSSRTWLVYVGADMQRPPQWEGSFYISGTEDLERLNGYSDINGSLSIMPFASSYGVDSGLDTNNSVIVRHVVDGRDRSNSLALGSQNQRTLITDLESLASLRRVEGSLYAFHNEQLDSLEGLHNVESINEDLMVYQQAYLQDLTGLRQLTTLGGDLYLQSNANLNSIESLANLSSLNGTVAIVNNDALTSLSGLQNISSVAGRFEINTNNNLESLQALSSLTSVNDNFLIMQNEKLVSLSGLDNLQEVTGKLFIEGNRGLTSISELSTLTSLGGLEIESNQGLGSLTGLENLSVIDGDLSIENHQSLTTLSALSGIQSVTGDLSITHNYIIQSLEGLDNIATVGGGLFIEQNTDLTDISSLYQLQDIGEHYYVRNNISLCNSEAQALFDLINARGGIHTDFIEIYNDSDC